MDSFDPKKFFYLVLGFLGLILAVIGTILPVMPTVPFLLLAAFGFSRGSEKFDNWFKSTRIYKNNLADYASGQGMTKWAKIRVMISLSFLFVFGLIMMRKMPIAMVIIVIVWLAHIWYFTFKVKTKLD